MLPKGIKLPLLLVPLIFSCASPNQKITEIKKSPQKEKLKQTLPTKGKNKSSSQKERKNISPPKEEKALKNSPQKVEKKESHPNLKKKKEAEQDKKLPKDYSLIEETALLAALKGSAQIQKKENRVYEAIPKRVNKNCYDVLVRVKELNSKRERDYNLRVCNRKVELK